MKKQIIFIISALILAYVFFITYSSPNDQESSDEIGSVTKSLQFDQRKIVDSAKFWWAHVPADVTGDGIADLVFIDDNSAGGYLGCYIGQQDPGLWQLQVIAAAPMAGNKYASGDLEAHDIDGDGDIDVVAVKHPGEWMDAGASAELSWFENKGSSWQEHAIGSVPDAVKDISFEDFDLDGKVDMSILTFDEHTLSIFRQLDKASWDRVQFIQNDVLHEGMAVGHLNDDKYPDIVATGLVYYNPGSDITQAWKLENLDARWNNQEGDWSRNGTKTFIADIDGDSKAEIFMAHSERGGYPLAIYSRSSGKWRSTIVKDSIVACHTLQVFDFDQDGDHDILAGVNRGRAVNLAKTEFPVSIFINQGDHKRFSEVVIESNGIYNGQVIDYDGDGDYDIFRYPDHESTDFYLMENRIID